MKLMDAVAAHMAADEMGALTWPFSIALALVKVMKETADDFSFYISKERELAQGYAKLDGCGNMELAQGGRFVFADPSKTQEYERLRSELAGTELGRQPEVIRVAAPEEIRPSWLAALEGFIEFE